MKKYVLFDLDGTLTDSRVGILNSIEYMLEYYGIHVEDRAQLQPWLGPPLKDSLMKYFPEQIRQYQGYIEGLEADMNTLAEHPHVGTGSISLTPPQAAEFVHSAVLPLPTKPKDGFAGVPVWRGEKVILPH